MYVKYYKDCYSTAEDYRNHIRFFYFFVLPHSLPTMCMDSSMGCIPAMDGWQAKYL